MPLNKQLARLGLATLLGTGVAILPVSFDPATPGGLELSKAWAKDGDRDDDRGRDDNDDRDDDDRGGDDNSGRGNGDDDRDDDRRSDSTDDSPSTGIEVATANGGRIEIENGIYELKNAAGETIVERPATAADYAALGATPPATAPAPDDNGGRTQIRVGRVVEIEQTATSIEVRYSRGWKEEIENGVYELKDPANRTVIERPATAADWDRLVATAG
ncbi:MAG: hypothetical protein ACE368_24070 [Paracoccaceae bacterium]